MKAKVWNLFYGTIALLGIAAMVWEIELYRQTFIQIWTLIILIIVPSILTYLAIKNHYCRTYRRKRFLFPFLQSVFSSGFLITTSFMAINFYFPHEDSRTVEYDILKVGELGGRNHKPYAVIRHNGQTKEIIFKRNPKLKISDKIRLKIHTGLFGFEIISETKILNTTANKMQHKPWLKRNLEVLCSKF